jgi:hypothetical protein
MLILFPVVAVKVGVQLDLVFLDSNVACVVTQCQQVIAGALVAIYPRRRQLV